MDVETIGVIATAIAGVIVAGATALNAITYHYSELEGDGVAEKVAKTVLWVIERLSLISTDGTLKPPMTERYGGSGSGDDDGGIEEALVVVGAVITAVVVLLSGCGSSLKSVDRIRTAADVAAPLVDTMCEPVEEICAERGLGPIDCDPLGECLQHRVTAAKGLRTLAEALSMAAMAFAAGDDENGSSWLRTALDGIRDVNGMLNLWMSK